MKLSEADNKRLTQVVNLGPIYAGVWEILISTNVYVVEVARYTAGCWNWKKAAYKYVELYYINHTY